MRPVDTTTVNDAMKAICTAGSGPVSTPVPDPAPRALDGDLAASQGIVREVPVGIVEIAQWLEVRRATTDRWRQRGIFPTPDMTVSGRPLWWKSTVETWAIATGRMPRTRG